VVSFFLLYFLRYKNQDLAFTGFEDKTGNVISLIFFGILILVILICFMAAKDISQGRVIFLFITSLFSLVTLIASYFISEKITKIIYIGVSLLINLFVLTSFLGISFSRSKSFGIIKSILLFLFIFIFSMGVVFFLILNYTDDYLLYSDTNKKADAGVILGAAVWGGNRPSPVLKERINKGYEIYRKKIVPKLVITGGGSPNELTEGEVSKNVLLKYGVAQENLILENSSSSTIEQIHFIRDSLYNVKNWNKVILVSDNYHLLRASEISKFNNVNADCVASDTDLSTAGSISFCLKESFALIIFWMSGV